MNNSKSTLKWLICNIRNRLPALFLLTICNIGQSICSVFFALGTKGVIDAAVIRDRDDFVSACVTQACIILGLLFFRILSTHLKERTSAALDRDWKRTLLHNLMESEYRVVSKYHSSELVNRLNNDVRVLDEAICNVVPNLSAMVTKLIAAFCVLTVLTPWFALGLLLAGIFVIIITSVLRRHLKGLHKRLSEADGYVSGIIQETMEKLLAVQAMDVTTEIERRAQKRLDIRFDIHRKRKNISLLANTCINVMFYFAGFAALTFCAFGLLSGSMTYGSMSAITQLVNQIQSPFVGLSGVIPQYIAATAAAERLMELTQLPKTVAPLEESGSSIYSRLENIVAEDMVFTYDRERILNSASFELPKGSFCVITGPSGTGKSTLLKLLLGIYSLDHGKLYLSCGNEQIPVNASTRRLFDYVPQGNLIFSGTIKENLLVVKPDATDEEIECALYVSAMDGFLPQLPNGLDTVLGESGAGLSEGQAQRLAIARAILGGAPILLLDECTSALDAATESLVLQRMKELPNKTCIAVTHRHIADSICDLHIQMNNGTIQIRYVN